MSRQTAVEDSAASLKRNLELAEKELAMTQPMVARGAVSEVEVLRLQRQIIELKGQIQDRRNSFKAEARGKQAEKEAELGGVTELLTARKDEVQRSLVRSPMRGTVKNIKVTTVGGVIGPGQDIMEIIPIEDRLFIEAKIRPADVAFLHAGQKATVKLTAYDYTIYGSLHGHLEHISADTIGGRESAARAFLQGVRAHRFGGAERQEGPVAGDPRHGRDRGSADRPQDRAGIFAQASPQDP